MLWVGLLLTGCTVVQNIGSKLPLSKTHSDRNSAPTDNISIPQRLVFMDPLPIKQDEPKSQPTRWMLKGTLNANKSIVSNEKLIELPPATSIPASSSFSKEGEVSALQMKFSVLLEQELMALPDPKLLAAIDPWMGVRYRSGGNSSQGIDCSAFTASVLSSYAGIQLPRTCREQYQQYPKVEKDEIQIGDLLFFRTRGRTVSHVGIYLGNNKFVHASSSNGVMVSSRSEPYFSSRFVGARRVPILSATESAFD